MFKLLLKILEDNAGPLGTTQSHDWLIKWDRAIAYQLFYIWTHFSTHFNTIYTFVNI